MSNKLKICLIFLLYQYLANIYLNEKKCQGFKFYRDFCIWIRGTRFHPDQNPYFSENHIRIQKLQRRFTALKLPRLEPGRQRLLSVAARVLWQKYQCCEFVSAGLYTERFISYKQICTENHATFPIQMFVITVQICGNF